MSMTFLLGRRQYPSPAQFSVSWVSWVSRFAPILTGGSEERSQQPCADRRSSSHFSPILGASAVLPAEFQELIQRERRMPPSADGSPEAADSGSDRAAAV